MRVRDLIQVLANCNPNDEVTFIFDSNSMLSRERVDGIFEVSQVNVTGSKINGKIPLTNGMSSKLLKGDEESIFIK